MSKYVPDDLKNMGKKELLEVALIVHEENVKLNAELKRESMELRSRLGAALGRNSEYNEAIENMQQKLAKANERVKELENAILDSCSTYHFEPDLLHPLSSLNVLLIINSKWTLDPEISSDAAKFAIEKKCEGIDDFMSHFRYEYEGARDTDSIESFADKFTEQLRKEQDGE